MEAKRSLSYPQQTTRRVLLTSIFIPANLQFLPSTRDDLLICGNYNNMEKQHINSEKKRDNYLSWDETFMLMAGIIAQRSKAPNTQVGACIVDENNVIVGLGYNGFPRGCSDDSLPWRRGREYKLSETKYAYVGHSEANAIFNANKPVKGCKLYCVLFPCNECAKIIIQTGIKEIIYQEDWYHDDEQMIASRKMLDLAGVKCRTYAPRYDIKKLFAAPTNADDSAPTVKSSPAAIDNNEFIVEEII